MYGRPFRFVDRHDAACAGAETIDVQVPFRRFNPTADADVARIGEDRRGRAREVAREGNAFGSAFREPVVVERCDELEAPFGFKARAVNGRGVHERIASDADVVGEAERVVLAVELEVALDCAVRSRIDRHGRIAAARRADDVARGFNGGIREGVPGRPFGSAGAEHHAAALSLRRERIRTYAARRCAFRARPKARSCAAWSRDFSKRWIARRRSAAERCF